MSARVGVVLSGCGVKDGSEIHEATSVLIALDKHGAEIICMAPKGDRPATNHLTGKPEAQSRDTLTESARIARGKIKDIATVKADDLDALIFPGGFGAAKNLCDYATAGAKAQVQPEVAKLIKAMHALDKPMGFACIAPVVAAQVLGKMGVSPRLTIGTDPATAKAINDMGGRHEETDPVGIVVDAANHLVSTPCYMNDVGPWTVYQGAEKMVEEVLKMAGTR
jgi:enhancing lycopene biosynthesis protein 2